MIQRQYIINTANKELGTKEFPKDSNIQKYGKWYGQNGVKWCGQFVSWVFAQSGAALGHIDSDNGYSSCQDGYKHFLSLGKITKNPQKGDIVFYDWNKDAHADHTGIFHTWIKQGESFAAYEGNTSVGNDSNGGEVMHRLRNIRSVIGFADMSYILD